MRTTQTQVYEKMKGRVIKGVSSKFLVDTENGIIECFARGNLKRSGMIYIGDIVETERVNGDYVITKILPRKNKLIRPYVANIDICLIVLAEIPKPDFILIDKIIINSILSKITPILVVNKSDISDNEFIDEINCDYNDVLQIIVTSAKNRKGIDEIKDLISGKVACLAGQSAVGKSSIINALLGENRLKTGDLSEKISRGKHTTRESVILKIGSSNIIDTCGFSMLELPPDVEPEKLSLFYQEFLPYISDCKYRQKCLHIREPRCAVREAVDNGEISKNRYLRYVELYNDLKDKWRKRYD